METMLIPVNRTKMLVAIISAAILFLYGVYLAFIVANDPTSHFSPMAMSIVGFTLIGLFGLAVGIGLKKLMTTKHALAISAEGFECKLLDPALGVIPWDAVYKIEIDSIMVNKALMLYVEDAQSYIDKSAGGVKKRVLKNHMLAYGTPFVVQLSVMKVNAADLDRMVRERWKARKATLEAAAAPSDEAAG